MTADARALLAANGAVYAAFESLDLDAMMGTWATTEQIWCVHPGGELVEGFSAVRRSWGAIFAATSYLQVVLTDESAMVSGDLGVVRCTENLLTSLGRRADLGGGRALTVNVFRREDGRWLLVGHHAAPPLRASPG